MMLHLRLHPCPCGQSLPLLPAAGFTARSLAPVAHYFTLGAPTGFFAVPPLPVGTTLHAVGPADRSVNYSLDLSETRDESNPQAEGENPAMFKVTGRVWLPAPEGAAPHSLCCLLLTALADLSPWAGRDLTLAPRKQGRSLAWVTLSDKGACGQREDLSGPAIAQLVGERLPLCHSQGFLLPDEPAPLRALLTELALGLGYDLICTTGGTGLSVRDISPQVTAALLDLPLPGFSQAMLAASLVKTPHAAISRAVAGVLGQSIIINLPGSHKAVLENLAAVLPALPHALDKLHGNPADCGG